jgi:glutaredoxin-related protein
MAFMVKYLIMKADSMGFALQDVLLLIGIQARSGELVIESGNNIGSMLFHEGRILQAFSPYSRAIGDLMVEDGLVTEEELIETLKLQKKGAYAPLGSLLIKTGKVTIEVIERMVQEQIRQSVNEFQSWQALHFSFVNKEMRPHDRIHLTIHEFLDAETLASAARFLSAAPQPLSQP